MKMATFIENDWRRLFWSWARVFLAAALTAFIATGSDPWAMDAEAWRAVVVAGIASVAPVLCNWLNPADDRYGLHALVLEEETEPEPEPEAKAEAVSLGFTTGLAPEPESDDTWTEEQEPEVRQRFRGGWR